jgi:hypothetical protein
MNGPREPLDELRAPLSALAWRILSILLKWKQAGFAGMPGWFIAEQLGTARSIKSARVKRFPVNEYEAALRELVEKGLVEELPDLGERWRLVVKGD